MHPSLNSKKPHQFSGYLGWMITVLFISVAIYCFLGICHQKQSGELFFPFGYRPVIILSGSMEEELKTGSMVLVKQTQEIAVNDIIFFLTEEGIPVIHRCIKMTENGSYITKGDANPKEDLEPVLPDQILGKVLWH